jgi:hypothetical protein
MQRWFCLKGEDNSGCDVADTPNTVSSRWRMELGAWILSESLLLKMSLLLARPLRCDDAGERDLHPRRGGGRRGAEWMSEREGRLTGGGRNRRSLDTLAHD